MVTTFIHKAPTRNRTIKPPASRRNVQKRAGNLLTILRCRPRRPLGIEGPASTYHRHRNTPKSPYIVFQGPKFQQSPPSLLLIRIIYTSYDFLSGIYRTARFVFSSSPAWTSMANERGALPFAKQPYESSKSIVKVFVHSTTQRLCATNRGYVFWCILALKTVACGRDAACGSFGILVISPVRRPHHKLCKRFNLLLIRVTSVLWPY